jgi:phage baseplate assembly protein W
MAYNSITTTGTNTAESADPSSHTATGSSRYSDINLQMIPHPLKRDIIPLKNENVVKNAVRNLIISNFFERPFAPTLAANLRGLLFEPADNITIAAIKNNILNVLKEYEPRIANIHILVELSPKETQYNVTVVFSIKEDDSIQDIEVNLKRLR